MARPAGSLPGGGDLRRAAVTLQSILSAEGLAESDRADMEIALWACTNADSSALV